MKAVFVWVDIVMQLRRRPNQVLVKEAIERDHMVLLERQVEQLTEQLAMIIANQNLFQTLNAETGGDSDKGKEGDEEVEVPQRQRKAAPEADDSRRWESWMRIEVPEFQGILQPEDFLEWVGIVEEILEFKTGLEIDKVALVATRLRGRAAAWWQQLKLTRNRLGKPKISSWEKMKGKLHAEFLPHNFQRLMYQRLQNLRQGMWSVNEYTTKFYQLLVRNEIQET